MRNQRILHVIEGFSMGGAERGLYNLLANRADPGLEHSIVAFKDGAMHDDFRRLGVETRVIPRRHTFDLACFGSLLNAVRACSLVHCRNSTSAVTLGGLAAKIAGVPLVTSIHGHGMFGKKGAKISLWHAMHRCAATTITVSRSIARELESLGHAPGKIRAIHNGLDLSAYRGSALTADRRAALRREFTGGEDRPVLGCIGSLREVKGQAFLIRAFRQVLAACPTALLILAGEGDDRPHLEELAASCGISPAVRFLGFRGDAFAIMQCLDVLVIPSVSEGISNVALEAMAFGTAVVATAVGGNPEIIVDGRNGFLVAYGDDAALAAALVELIKNEATRSSFAAQGEARVAAEFSLCRMVAEYEEVYASILSGKGGTRGRNHG